MSSDSSPPGQTSGTAVQGTSSPSLPAIPSASSKTPAGSAPPEPADLKITTAGTYHEEPGLLHLTGGISMSYLGTTITSDTLDGDPGHELVFSGHTRITRDGLQSEADAIHYFPADGRYRLDNPRGVLSPSLFEGKVYDPIFVQGGSLQGDDTGYSLADRFIATTCREHFHHYELRPASAEVIPHDEIVLRRVGIYLFGVRLVVIPKIEIPLNERTGKKPRTDYLPEFGQNNIEGYFARFPYAFSTGHDAGALVRLDLTQNLGPGYRYEQEYLAGKQPNLFNTSGYGYGGSSGFSPGANGVYATAYGYGSAGSRLPRLGTGVGPQDGGLFTMQGYFQDAFNRNFNATLHHHQDIGGSNSFSLDSELQKNSSFAPGGSNSSSSAQTSHFDFAHNDSTHGVSDDFNVNLSNSNSSGYSSDQLTADLKQSYQFASSASTQNSLSLDLDLTRLLSSSSNTTGTQNATRSERLDENFQLQHIARDYSLTLNANDSTPIGFQSSNTNYGTLEKLPELLMSTDTFSYRGGWLRKIPTQFQFGVGEYSEPTNNITTDRVLLGFNVEPFYVLKGRTEVVTGGGYEQRIYGDGAALYILQNETRLRQHLAGRSGIDLTYQYTQSEGGTPFNFDTPYNTHTLTAAAGYLDDSHFQLTAQAGYDLLGVSQTTPWQSLATHLMWRPTHRFRFDATQTFDPNTGKFSVFNQQLMLRGAHNFGMDFVWSIDPTQPGLRKKLTAFNTQFDVPIGNDWRLQGLFRYNGLSGQLESRNLQIIHDWDCMEATLSYTENIGGYRPDRQIYFAIRIKAFPFYHAFNRGPAGETIGTGIGSFY